MPRSLAGTRTLAGTRNTATRRLVANFQYSLDFNPSSNQLGAVITPAFCTTKSRTIEWWSKFNTTPTSTSPIFSLAAANYYVGFTTNSILSSYADGSAVQRTGSGASPLVSGIWDHWAYTVDTSGSDVTENYYKNGVNVGTRTLSGGHSASFGGALYLGTFATGAGSFNGKMAQLSFYDRALSSSEILNRSNNIEISNGLSERWNFSEGSGSSLTGINGTVLTLANSPTWSTDVPCKNRTIVT